MNALKKRLPDGIRDEYRRTMDWLRSMQGSKKALYWGCNLLLALYLPLILLMSTLELPALSRAIIPASVGALPLLIYLSYKLSGLSIPVSAKRGLLGLKTFLMASGLQLAIFLLYLKAYFPGGMSPDVFDQWYQVQTGVWWDWHPVAHTLSIWLISRVFDSLTFVILVQMAAFSIAVGYLAATLKAWGLPPWTYVLSTLMIALNPATGNIISYPWKDCALAIFMLLAATQLLQVILSRGEWLRMPLNRLAFSLVLSAASLMRHNAFLATFPMLILITLCYWKTTKKVVLTLVLTIALVAGVKGPLYGALGVLPHSSVYGESIGLPLTILGNVITRHGEDLDADIKGYLNTLASDEEWRAYYIEGNWNSVKFNKDMILLNESIESLDPGTFLSYTARAVKDYPEAAYDAARELTRMVWGISGRVEWSLVPSVIPNDFGYRQMGDQRLKAALMKVLKISTNRFFAPLFWFVGVYLLILMILASSRVPAGGFRALLPLMPLVFYGFGTMLLLSGPDYRFFYYFVPVFFPMALGLLADAPLPE